MGSRINDHEADDLMAGRVPQGRPDLVGLAETISAVRTEYRAVPVPVPSELLAAVLEGRHAVSPSSASGTAVAPPSIVAAARSPLGVVAALTKGVHAVKNWLTELELVSKVALGSGALVLAVSGVGAAGALPGDAQTAFDRVVSTVVPQGDEVDDDSIVFDDDELEVDDDSPREDDDEAEVDDGSPREDDDEAEVDDGSPREDDDEAEVDDGSPREDDDEAEVDDGSSREEDDEAEVDDDGPRDDGDDDESDDDESDDESEAEVDED